MPAVTLETTWTRPPTSPNARLHPRAQARVVREARQTIAWRARAAGIPTGLQHATVTVHHRPADKRGVWDADNAMAGCKPIFDALTARGAGYAHPVVADDTAEFMTQRVVQHAPVSGRPAALWVVVAWDEAEERAS